MVEDKQRKCRCAALFKFAPKIFRVTPTAKPKLMHVKKKYTPVNWKSAHEKTYFGNPKNFPTPLQVGGGVS